MHRPFQIITQGYLHDDDPLVRIRTINWSDGLKWARCTLKGRGLAEREEIEFPMPYGVAEEALALWAKSKLIKHRYILNTPPSPDPNEDRVWELDQFQLELEGLWIAEIELKHQDQPFDIPEWLGREVTQDSAYANVNLARFGKPTNTQP
jgi:adenylate cyclase